MKIDASSFERFAAKTTQVARTVPQANRSAIMAAARETKDAVAIAGMARGWPKARKWVGYTFAGSPERMTAIVRLRSGPAYWAERGTQAHDIEPRSVTGRGRRKGKAAALSTPYGPRAKVHVAGAKPRPFWYAGITAAVPRVTKVVDEAISATIRKVFV